MENKTIKSIDGTLEYLLQKYSQILADKNISGELKQILISKIECLRDDLIALKHEQFVQKVKDENNIER